MNPHCISRFGQAYDILERGSLLGAVIHKVRILIYEHHYIRILSPRIFSQSGKSTFHFDRQPVQFSIGLGLSTRISAAGSSNPDRKFRPFRVNEYELHFFLYFKQHERSNHRIHCHGLSLFRASRQKDIGSRGKVQPQRPAVLVPANGQRQRHLSIFRISAKQHFIHII